LLYADKQISKLDDDKLRREMSDEKYALLLGWLEARMALVVLYDMVWRMEDKE
jgi:hypothetical protein